MFGDPAKFPLAFPRVPSETDITEIKRTLNDFGLKIVEIAGGGDYLNPDGARREFEITVEQMRSAHRLGAQYFRLCDIWPDSEDVFAKISGVIRQLGESAKELPFTIIVENHGGLMATGKQNRRLMEAVGMKNVGVNYDPANYAYYGEDPLKALREIRPFVRFVHFKNVRFTGGHAEYCRLRDGVIDYRTIWPALFPEYRGYVCLEYEKAEDVKLGTQDDLTYLQKIGRGQNAK